MSASSLDTSGSYIHGSSKASSNSMSAPPLRRVRHESVIVFAVAFRAHNRLLRGNVTATLLATQTFGLNYSVEAHICFVDGYATIDELPQPVAHLRMVDAG